uniref:Uncharacterized protein n=1 Tax=Plectus sambesii TaxID=2011161 RepID=A0A914VHX1_9BILA
MAAVPDKPGFGGVYLGPATDFISHNPAPAPPPPMGRVASFKRSALGRSSSKKKKAAADDEGGGSSGVVAEAPPPEPPVWGGVYVGPTTSTTPTVKPPESASDAKEQSRRSSRSKSPKAGALSVGALTDHCSLHFSTIIRFFFLRFVAALSSSSSSPPLCRFVRFALPSAVGRRGAAV